MNARRPTVVNTYDTYTADILRLSFSHLIGYTMTYCGHRGRKRKVDVSSESVVVVAGQSSNVVECVMMSMFLGNNGERERTVDSLPDGLSLES